MTKEIKVDYVRCPNCSNVYEATQDKCPKCDQPTVISESQLEERVFNILD